LFHSFFSFPFHFDVFVSEDAQGEVPGITTVGNPASLPLLLSLFPYNEHDRCEGEVGAGQEPKRRWVVGIDP